MIGSINFFSGCGLQFSIDADHQLQWDLFFDPQERCGQKRLEAQYLRVNINPSDRYVLSITGSVSARMRADEFGVDNLYLAGDWVRTGINAGCIEASVMAGRAAAAAITGVSHHAKLHRL